MNIRNTKHERFFSAAVKRAPITSRSLEGSQSGRRADQGQAVFFRPEASTALSVSYSKNPDKAEEPSPSIEVEGRALEPCELPGGRVIRRAQMSPGSSVFVI